MEIKRALLTPGPSQLKTCLYCPNTLKDAAEEHIFLQSWGGTTTTRNLVCSDCNDKFGRTIDPSFSTFVKVIRNTWGITTDRDPNIPEIKSSTANYTIGSHGQPIPIHEPELIATVDEGDKLSVMIKNYKNRTSAKKLHRDFEGIEKQIKRKLTDKEKENLNKSKTTVQYENTIETVYREDTFLVQPWSQYRSVANTALKALAYYFPEVIIDPVFEGIKNFVHGNEDDYLQHATIVSSLPQFTITQNKYGRKKSNSVEIFFSHQLNKTIATVTILSSISRSIVLSNSLPKIIEGDKTFSILTVLESLNHSGRLDAHIFMLENYEDAGKIINILPQKPDVDYFKEEVTEFTYSHYVIEPVIAKALAILGQMLDERLFLKDDFDEKLFGVIVDFIEESLRRQKFSISRLPIIERLNEFRLKEVITKIFPKIGLMTAEAILNEIIPVIYSTMGKFREELGDEEVI